MSLAKHLATPIIEEYGETSRFRCRLCDNHTTASRALHERHVAGKHGLTAARELTAEENTEAVRVLERDARELRKSRGEAEEDAGEQSRPSSPNASPQAVEAANKPTPAATGEAEAPRAIGTKGHRGVAPAAKSNKPAGDAMPAAEEGAK